MIRKYQLIICWKTWIWIILTIYFWGPKFHFTFCWHSFSPRFCIEHWRSRRDERLGTYRITHEKKGTWLEANLQGMKCSSRPSSSGVYWNTITRLVNAALTNSKQWSWLKHPPERPAVRKTTPGNVFEILNLNFKAILGSGFPYGLAVSPQCLGLGFQGYFGGQRFTTKTNQPYNVLIETNACDLKWCKLLSGNKFQRIDLDI